jgi:hypothetical protein
VRSVAPLLGAGGVFAGASLAGFWIGILVDERTGGASYVVAGLFVGMLIGAYAAARLLMRSL